MRTGVERGAKRSRGSATYANPGQMTNGRVHLRRGKIDV